MKQSALRTHSLKLRAAVLRAALLLVSASSGTGNHLPAAWARNTVGRTDASADVAATATAGADASVTRFEESAAHLNLAEDWFEMGSAGTGVALNGGLAIYSRLDGSTATFGFRGTGVRWIGLPCEMCGIAEV